MSVRLVPSPDNAQESQRMGDALAQQIEGAAKTFAETAKRDVQESIDTPVEYLGPFAIRSAPGEPPRMETGNLHDGITATVKKEGDSIVVEVAATTGGAESDPNVPGDLEFGTDEIAARPFMGTSFERIKAEMPNILKGLLLS